MKNEAILFSTSAVYLLSSLVSVPATQYGKAGKCPDAAALINIRQRFLPSNNGNTSWKSRPQPNTQAVTSTKQTNQSPIILDRSAPPPTTSPFAPPLPPYFDGEVKVSGVSNNTRQVWGVWVGGFFKKMTEPLHFSLCVCVCVLCVVCVCVCVCVCV